MACKNEKGNRNKKTCDVVGGAFCIGYNNCKSFEKKLEEKSDKTAKAKTLTEEAND
jgi:hypothetical protein